VTAQSQPAAQPDYKKTGLTRAIHTEQTIFFPIIIANILPKTEIPR